MTDITLPIGYDDQGQPIEEVITTATRLRPEIPWGALFAGAGVGALLYVAFDTPRRRSGRRRRA